MSSDPRGRAWIVGASAGIGRSLAETLAARGWHLVLTARDARDLEALAADLRTRHGAAVHVLAADLAAEDFRATALAARAFATQLNVVIVAAGALMPGDDEPSEEALRASLRLNLEACAGLAAASVEKLEGRGGGDVVLVSSIAAHAPRARNMAYSAAKAGLETYAAALRHHGAARGVRVQWCAPGYVDTGMTFGKKLALPVASAEGTARALADSLGRDRGLWFYPWWWGPIVRVLRLLPWSLYKRLRF